MTRRSQYPQELRQRAVRMVAEVTPEYDLQWAAIKSVALKRVRQAEVNAGQRPGVTSENRRS